MAVLRPGLPMALTCWQDHVVHVEVPTGDGQPANGYARVLTERFAGSAFCSAVSTELVEVRSDPGAAVPAADVARALAQADLPSTAVFERLEWSVATA